MSITQNSQIKIRSGLQESLPQLAQGELGYAVDTQRLFIGMGTPEVGAPMVGNMEIITMATANTVSPSVPTPVSGNIAGTIDGNNTVFTLPVTNYVEGSLIIWCNFPLIPNIGYTANGNTITFANAPSAGDVLFFQSWVNPS